MDDNIIVSTDAILSDINNASPRVENTTTSVDDEIAAMRIKIQNRQMNLIETSLNASTRRGDDENEHGQIDLDDEGVFERSGLEDALLMQRMQDARHQYRQYLEDMEQIPDIMQLRTNHVTHICTISDEITILNNMYTENHEAMCMPHRVLKKLIEIITTFKVRKFDTIESDLESCIKLLKTSQTSCDTLMGRVKKTQDTLFVLRRELDKNCEDMLRSVAAHKEKVVKLNSLVNP